MNERVRFQLSSAVFVILACGPEICMLQRKATGWMDGSFSIPAGALDAGETIRAAAVREAFEETGVIIAPEALKPVHTLHSLTAGNQWLGHFFRANEWTGTPAICEPDKHAYLEWRSLNDLPENTIPYVRQALLCAARDELYSEYGWN
ncbi:NUDIX domain-containing protein [Ochrobactrum vermis]|uniref:NUDIX domain-containing protein n=1 Tax=Ochrobactrum vermis TaxID=1827297 RepID=A0ABU8PHH8_9HYPH|nr:NUDIX domain-containing protein [Ochrobactrum vermis]PQZ26029.1 DNA mismatch repair protein MutT [Ochrobactrum vermis]